MVNRPSSMSICSYYRTAPCRKLVEIAATLLGHQRVRSFRNCNQAFCSLTCTGKLHSGVRPVIIIPFTATVATSKYCNYRVECGCHRCRRCGLRFCSRSVSVVTVFVRYLAVMIESFRFGPVTPRPEGVRNSSLQVLNPSKCGRNLSLQKILPLRKARRGHSVKSEGAQETTLFFFSSQSLTSSLKLKFL